MVEPSKPLVLLGRSGKILDIAFMNDKSYRKSTEQGTLWHTHEETGRVLPYQKGIRLAGLEDRDRWFEATVVENVAPATDGGETTGQSGSETRLENPHDWGRVLGGLIDIIRERKRKLPEGSYTSYLFSSGIDKIRKKTGEEAIELLLAKKDTDIACEAADFLYHLLVMLEELEIPFSAIIAELGKRRGISPGIA